MQPIPMSVQWMSGKSSLHFDTIMYYHILHREYSLNANILEKSNQRWLVHCEPLAEKAIKKRA